MEISVLDLMPNLKISKRVIAMTELFKRENGYAIFSLDRTIRKLQLVSKSKRNCDRQRRYQCALHLPRTYVP